MAIPTCIVTGTVLSSLGTPMAGALIKVNSVAPFFHPFDGSLILDYEVTATSDNDGTWSITLIETTTPLVSLTLSFYYAGGSNSNNKRHEYTIIVPNSPTATLQSLIGSQI